MSWLSGEEDLLNPPYLFHRVFSSVVSSEGPLTLPASEDQLVLHLKLIEVHLVHPGQLASYCQYSLVPST